MDHQLAQEGESVHARHFNVQHHDIRSELHDFVARHVGVGRGSDNLNVLFAAQFRGEHLPHDGRVVYDQYANRHGCRPPCGI